MFKGISSANGRFSMVFRYNSYPRLIGINGLAGTVMDPTAGCNPGCVAAMAMAAMAGCVAIPSAGRGVGTEAAMAASRVQHHCCNCWKIRNPDGIFSGLAGENPEKHQSHPSRITGISVIQPAAHSQQGAAVAGFVPRSAVQCRRCWQVAAPCSESCGKHHRLARSQFDG